MGTRYENKIPQFSFSKPNQVASLIVFKDEFTSEIEQDLNLMKSVFEAVNNFNGIMLLTDLLKQIIDLQVFNNDSNDITA